MRTQMTLASEAHELFRVLQAVVTALDRFNAPSQRNYTRAMADKLRPLMAEFQSALSEHSRSAAEGVLADIRQSMHEVNGAVTKGEMDVFTDDTLDRFWRISTLFQERRFA